MQWWKKAGTQRCKKTFSHLLFLNLKNMFLCFFTFQHFSLNVFYSYEKPINMHQIANFLCKIHIFPLQGLRQDLSPFEKEVPPPYIRLWPSAPSASQCLCLLCLVLRWAVPPWPYIIPTFNTTGSLCVIGSSNDLCLNDSGPLFRRATIPKVRYSESSLFRHPTYP